MRTLNSRTTAIPCLLALMLAVVQVFGGSQAVSAQETGLIDQQTYVSELTGEKITWSIDWLFSEDQLRVEPDREFMTFGGVNGFLVVEYLEDMGEGLESTLFDHMELYAFAFGDRENVERGEAGNGFYSLDRYANGEQGLVFALFSVISEVDGFVRIVIASSAPDNLGSIEDCVALAKSTVAFGGIDAFESVDSVTESGVVVASQSGNVEDSVHHDTSVTSEEDGLNEDWLDAGLISENEYVSPQFGYSIGWNEPWVLDNYYDTPGQPGTVATKSGMYDADRIYLWVNDYSAVLIIASFDPALNDVTLDQFESLWQSEDFLGGTPFENLSIKVEDEVGASLFFVESGYIGYDQVSLAADGESMLTLAFLAPADEFEESFELAQDEIEINGQGSFDVFSDAEVEDLVADYLP